MSAKEKLSEVFREEYRKLQALVRFSVRDLYEGLEPEDVIQEVALNIFSKPDFNILIENYTGYIYQAVRNRIRNLQTRQKPVQPLSRVHSEDDDSSRFLNNLTDEEESQNYWEDSVMQQKLKDAISQLAPHEQMIIYETEYNDQTFESLSKIWDIPVGTLLARKHRALTKLRKILQPEKEKLNN
ncbi:MAG: RNA polymerase sigma factor [Bacteroidales bacterium]